VFFKLIFKEGSGFRVQGSGFRVQRFKGSRFKGSKVIAC
jgi:hypothetical protein